MVGNEALYQKAMNQGHSEAWDEMWDQAAFFYRQALEQFPDNPKALTSLGLALIELQQYEEALGYYRRASVITPHDPLPIEKVSQITERLGRLDDATRAALQAADLYIKNHEIEKAIDNWIRITRFKPENLAAHSRLAMIYERLGRLDDAVSEYLAVASLVQRGGDLVKASQAVNYAFKIKPDSTEARQALLLIKNNQLLPKPVRPHGGTGPVLMEKVRQFESSESGQAEKSLIDPITEARQKALVSLAGILFEGNDTEESPQTGRHDLMSVTRNEESEEIDEFSSEKMSLYLGQAIDAQTQKRDMDAVEELKKAIRSGLVQPAAYFDLGLLLYKGKRYEQAVAALRVALRHPDYSLAARMLIGGSFQEMGRLNEAAVEFLEALKIADSSTAATPQDANEMAQLYESLIDTQSQQIDSKTSENLCNNIVAMLGQPDWRSQLTKARKQLPVQAGGSMPLPLAEVMLQSHSSQVVESLALIHSMVEKDQIRTAMEEAFFALSFAPGYLPLHIEIGELLLKENYQKEAIQKFSIVAQVYNSRGATDQAVRLFRRITQLNPMDLSVRSRLIESLVLQGNIDEAIRENINLADTYYRLTELDSARKTYMDALHLAQQSNSNRKWSTKVLEKIADIDMQRLDWRQALRVFEQIRILQPDDEKVRLNLIDINFRIGQENTGLTELDGYIQYLEGKTQIEKAIDFVEDLIADRPSKIELHWRLAELYQKAGKQDKSIETLDTIGDLLISSGNKQGAIKVIQAILNLNPPNADEYKKLLQQIDVTS